MRYMLLIYNDEQAREAMAPEERKRVFGQARAVMEEATRCGIFVSAAPLQVTRTATTVRVQNGKAAITDGPFAETKEQLGGYFLLDCKDLDEALEWAARIPAACGGGTGCVEVRPVYEPKVGG